MTRTDFTTLNERFGDAWADLAGRLANAVGTLTTLRAKHADDAERARLDAKMAGVRRAMEAYTALDEQATATGDYAAAWRLFSDRIAVEVARETDPTVREGLLLANGYQRGYAPDIDAPALIVR